MKPRQQRGLEIAAVFKIAQKGKVWLVPSQTGNGRKYTVCPDTENPHCSCPDHEAGYKCKHIYAVEYVIQREFAFNQEGQPLAETTTVTQTVRRTYPQNWTAYNDAQTHEKERFLGLLDELCNGVTEPQQAKTGRPRLPLRDAIFAAVFKVYSTVSARRFMTDLSEAQAAGYIAKTPHFNSVLNYLDNPDVTPILKAMIVESSQPLKAVESDFAVDSSGFTTSRFHRWYDEKYGTIRELHDWVKVHIMVGVKTNIVTAVEIRERNSNDCPLLPPLLDMTQQSFGVSEVSADKAYASNDNFKAIEAVGATPYIAFRQGTTGSRWAGGAFRRAFHYFCLHRDTFTAHYHKRSNVESTFSAIKRKFGDSVRSKTDTAMVNEALCKILCHNLCVLIHEAFELGIEATFWAGSAPAQKAAAS
jgi:transposase